MTELFANANSGPSSGPDSSHFEKLGSGCFESQESLVSVGVAIVGIQLCLFSHLASS